MASNDDKHQALLQGVGTPQVGRREAPEPEDPKRSRRLYARGLALGAVVVAATLIIVAVVCASHPL